MIERLPSSREQFLRVRAELGERGEHSVSRVGGAEGNGEKPQEEGLCVPSLAVTGVIEPIASIGPFVMVFTRIECRNHAVVPLPPPIVRYDF